MDSAPWAQGSDLLLGTVGTWSMLAPVTCMCASHGLEVLCLCQLLPASFRKPSWPALLCSVWTLWQGVWGQALSVRRPQAQGLHAFLQGRSGAWWPGGSGVAGGQHCLQQLDAGCSSRRELRARPTLSRGGREGGGGVPPKPVSTLTVGSVSRRQVLGRLSPSLPCHAVPQGAWAPGPRRRLWVLAWQPRLSSHVPLAGLRCPPVPAQALL